MEIKVFKEIMSGNQQIADENRKTYLNQKIYVINVMASPGAGKTSTLLKLIPELKNNFPVGVIEGDIASSIDAEKINRLGTNVIQINTGGGCHLDANMIRETVPGLKLQENSIVFIENVGNLVCPSEFDLGENLKLLITSITEGDDKPYKYLNMFANADVIILNKIDLLPLTDFNREYFYKGVRALNPDVPVFEVSCKTGEGFAALIKWLYKTID